MLWKILKPFFAGMWFALVLLFLVLILIRWMV